MRINTNVPAMNALRMLGKSSTNVARSVGRLSSGFRINRAADDAAGLGIANSLRATIKGLEQASRNAEQSQSLLQVAEGGAQQVESILERMKQLATQSASDNVNDDDRALIQAEFNELQSEISRIVSTTKFQGNVLLDGSMGNTVDSDVANSTILDAVEVQSVAISGVDAGTYTVTNNGDSTLTLENSDASLTQTVDLTGVTGATTVSFDAFGITLQTTTGFDASTGTHAAGDIEVTGADSSFLVSVSGDPSGDDSVSFSSVDLSLATLGIDSDSLATKADAVTAITNIDTAIGNVSSAFGTLGAAMNRIDFASANTNTALENFSAAESVIRDADMAHEVSELTKNQILQQAGTAMLAQANAMPQSVLSLLQ